MKPLARRLTALEQQRENKGQCKGIRFFEQSADTAEVFYEGRGPFWAGEQGYTRSDLDLLSEDGWYLITIIREERPPQPLILGQ